MRKLLIGTLLALAFFAATAPDAEAGCRRGGRSGIFSRLRERRQERRDNGGGLFHRLRDRRGCSGCGQ